MKKYLLFIMVFTFLGAAACFAESSVDDFLKRTEEARALKIDLLLPKTLSEQLGVQFSNSKSEETSINLDSLNKAVGIHFDVAYMDMNGKRIELYCGSSAGYPYDIPDNERTLKIIKNGDILYSEKLNRRFFEFCKEFTEKNSNVVKILSIRVEVELYNTIRVKDSKNMTFYAYADFTQDMIDSFFPQFSPKEK